MVAAVFLWSGLGLVVAAVWLLCGVTGGAVAVGVYGLLAAATGAAGVLGERDGR